MHIVCPGKVRRLDAEYLTLTILPFAENRYLALRIDLVAVGVHLALSSRTLFLGPIEKIVGSRTVCLGQNYQRAERVNRAGNKQLLRSLVGQRGEAGMLQDQSRPGRFGAEKSEIIGSIAERPCPQRKRETDLIVEALLREYYGAPYRPSETSHPIT